MYPQLLPSGITILSEGPRRDFDAKRRPHGRKTFNCKCHCGYEFNTLDFVAKKSIGCVLCRRKRQKKAITRHGMHDTKVRRTRSRLFGRCNNPKNPRYKDYGGRGIEVCEDRKIFEHFYRDMGDPPTPKHSLDRIDNDGDYCKENCRWTTPKTQSRNRRNNNKYDGKTLGEWSDLTKIGESALRYRIEHGLPIEIATMIPYKPQNRKPKV